jgi:hypothetical protein
VTLGRISLAVAASIVVGAVAIGAPTPAPVPAKHFDHGEAPAGSVDSIMHGSQKLTCVTCHSLDAKGAVAVPGGIGHAPCMDAKCHATDFISVGPTTRAKDPARFAKAAGLCLGCHDSPDGQPPTPFAKPSTSAAKKSFELEREYHVEMPHFQHTQATACRDCHVVDETTKALTTDAPGHTQCMTCHNAKSDPKFTMAMFMDPNAGEPNPLKAAKGSRPAVDVRACNSEGYKAWVDAQKLDPKKPKDHVACFQHELQKDGKFPHRMRVVKGVLTEVQCDQCHTLVIANKYQSLVDLHTKPIIDNTEEEHKACGASGCHVAEIPGGPRPNCLKCHANHERAMFQ